MDRKILIFIRDEKAFLSFAYISKYSPWPEHRPEEAERPGHIEHGLPAEAVSEDAGEGEDDQRPDTGPGPEDALQSGNKLYSRMPLTGPDLPRYFVS